MPLKKIYVDANLMVLLVVGATGKHLITKHKRLNTYQIEDYERLLNLVTRIEKVLVTPNILTEASNLLAQHGNPERSRFFDVLRTLIIEGTEEIPVASKTATGNREFTRLGLTDSALLEVVSKSTPVITVDLDLYLAASAVEAGSAFNFRHHQSWLQEIFLTPPSPAHRTARAT